MNGWIKLHRSLVGHPRYSDPEWLTVWVYLLLNAVYEVTEKLFDGRVVKLQPGQLVTGRHVIAVATGVHESKVFRILQQLKNEQQIEQQAGAKSSIITVLNWHRYQATEQQNEQPVNSKRTASEQQSNTIEESKKKKNSRKEEATPSPNGGEKEYFSAFVGCFQEAFGEIYSHQKADFVHLASWHKSHSEITPVQFAGTCRQVWASRCSLNKFLTLRGICSDWSSVVATVKKSNNQQPTGRITGAPGKYEHVGTNLS